MNGHLKGPPEKPAKSMSETETMIDNFRSLSKIVSILFRDCYYCALESFPLTCVLLAELVGINAFWQPGDCGTLFFKLISQEAVNSVLADNCSNLKETLKMLYERLRLRGIEVELSLSQGNHQNLSILIILKDAAFCS